jgi:hypothetical protein
MSARVCTKHICLAHNGKIKTNALNDIVTIIFTLAETQIKIFLAGKLITGQAITKNHSLVKKV